MMTEDEASTKWCPFAKRFPYATAKEAEEIAAQGIHPDYADEMAAMFPCIGSRCAAWKFERTQFAVIHDGEPEAMWAWDPRTSKAPYYADVAVREVRHGRCGMVSS